MEERMSRTEPMAQSTAVTTGPAYQDVSIMPVPPAVIKRHRWRNADRLCGRAMEYLAKIQHGSWRSVRYCQNEGDQLRCAKRELNTPLLRAKIEYYIHILRGGTRIRCRGHIGVQCFVGPGEAV